MTSAQPQLAPLRVASTEPSNPTELRDDPQLEQLGQTVERHARTNSVPVEFLGVEPLFAKPRLYGETSRPWVICPAAADPLVREGLPIPSAQRRQLDAVVDAGMDFPHIFLAHELPGATGGERPGLFETYRVLTDAEAHRLIVRPDAPQRTVETAKGVGAIARAAGRGTRLAAMGVAAAAAAPFALVAEGLDPAVLGAITLPNAGHKPGTPAAWFLLARWDW